MLYWTQIRDNNICQLREEIKLLVKKGEIYYADLDGTQGCEQGGVRPVLIIQNDTGNLYSSTVMIAPLTSKRKNNQCTHFVINKENTGLRCDSVAMMEQVRTIDKSRLKARVGQIDLEKYNHKITDTLYISTEGLEAYYKMKKMQQKYMAMLKILQQQKVTV